MAAWRLNNYYDRPIPRRIVKEAGVPRSALGQRKKAASVLLFFNPRLFAPPVRSEYEALACTVTLAAGLGCREAVSLKNSRDGGDDSARAIAERLGLRAHEFERLQMAEQNFGEVAEFLVTGTGGEDFCYRNFAPALKRRILLTGFRGDKCWDLHNAPNATFGGADLSGCSLQEFRCVARSNSASEPVRVVASG
jgi:hypothetical protein